MSIIIASPSGMGKTNLIKAIRKEIKYKLVYLRRIINSNKPIEDKTIIHWGTTYFESINFQIDTSILLTCKLVIIIKKPYEFYLRNLESRKKCESRRNIRPVSENDLNIHYQKVDNFFQNLFPIIYWDKDINQCNELIDLIKSIT